MHPLARGVIRIAGTLLVIYLTACLGLVLMQRQLLYFPTNAAFDGLDREARRLGFEPWLNLRGETIGWRREPPQRPARGAVVIFHGNAGHALQRSVYAESLQRVANLEVFILEYPGYGFRSGRPGEESLYAAAEDALASTGGHSKLFVMGESLGTGVACYVAGRHQDKVHGVLLLAPYDRLANVAQEHMPLFPVRWMLRDRYPSVDHLQDFPGAVAVWVGARDSVVPARFGRALFDSLGGRKRLWDAPEGGHEDAIREPVEWWSSVVKFLDSGPLQP